MAHLSEEVLHARTLIDEKRHGILAVLLLEPFAEVEGSLSHQLTPPIKLEWTNNLSAGLFVEAKRKDHGSRRRELARLKQQLDSGPTV